MSRRNRVIRGLWLMALLWGTGAMAQGNSVITGTLQSAEDKRPLEDVG